MRPVGPGNPAPNATDAQPVMIVVKARSKPMKVVAGLATVAVLLVGCATGPKFSDQATKIKPLPPDQTRIYVYRLPALLGAAIQPAVLLDGERVGSAVPGGVFFVDVAPGRHILSVTSDTELILPLNAIANETKYVRLMVEPSTWTTNIRPVAVDTEIGQHEIRDLSWIRQ
jgi:Protein of unknown function (DUF2846)